MGCGSWQAGCYHAGLSLSTFELQETFGLTLTQLFSVECSCGSLSCSTDTQKSNAGSVPSQPSPGLYS